MAFNAEKYSVFTGWKLYHFVPVKSIASPGYQLSVIGYRLSVIGYRLSVIGYQGTGYRVQDLEISV
jgi:hypothetical protein